MALAPFEWDEGELVVRGEKGEAVRISERQAAQMLEYLACGRVTDVEALMLAGACRARAEEMGRD